LFFLVVANGRLHGCLQTAVNGGNPCSGNDPAAFGKVTLGGNLEFDRMLGSDDLEGAPNFPPHDLGEFEVSKVTF
jgi:hypothetical protein